MSATPNSCQQEPSVADHAFQESVQPDAESASTEKRQQTSAGAPQSSTEIQKRLLPQPQKRGSRGKQPQWRDLDTLGAVKATVRLPDASINGSKQKRVHWHSQLKLEFDRLLSVLSSTYSELSDREKIDVWRSRSGRSVAEQGQKSLAICRKLRGCLRLVEAHRFTGNPSESDKMRCAVGLYNKVIKVSHFYDVFCNPNYIIGKRFPFPKTFDWLNKHTTELDPVPLEHNQSEQCDPDIAGASGGADDGAQDAGKAIKSGEEREDASGKAAQRKRPMGVKAAKSAKKAKKEAAKEDVALQSALDSWTKGFTEASSASLKAANSRAVINKKQCDRDYDLRKEADELEAVRVLFNDDDEESKQYRSALKKKRLRKLLQEQHDENQGGRNTERSTANSDYQREMLPLP